MKEGLSLRKTSISHANTPAAFGMASPTSGRPGTRRRDTSDSFPFPLNTVASPSGNSRFSRDEGHAAVPPPALLRRRTDFKDSSALTGSEDRDKDKQKEGSAETSIGFGSLKRTATGPLSAGLNGLPSPWATTPQSAGFSSLGSFGNFALGGSTAQASTPTEKRTGFGSLRAESRFKGLMVKDGSDEAQKTPREESSLGNLAKVNENDAGRGEVSWMEARLNRPTSNNTDPFPEDELRTGSAALRGGRDSPPRRQQAFGTPVRQDSRDDAAFAAFGMTSGGAGIRDMMQGDESYQHQTPHQRGVSGGQEPMSPTDTNPYQSPDHEQTDPGDMDSESSEIHTAHLSGLGGFPADQGADPAFGAFGGFTNIGRMSASYDMNPSDRSQSSSTGPSRAFGNLSGVGSLQGLGGSAAWPAGQGAPGTSLKDKSGAGGFGDVAFSAIGALQSPGLAGLGSNAPFAGGVGAGSVGRGSRMGSLFPAAMQEQMRAAEQWKSVNEDGSIEGNERSNVAGTPMGRGAFGAGLPGSSGPARDTDSPFRSGRAAFEEAASNPDGSRTMLNQDPLLTPVDALNSIFSQGQASGALQTPTASGVPRTIPSNLQRQSQSVNSPTSNQPPAAQQRTMVMPDRMRWIYRDPQGNTQGPWSGLEMHDWYKAGFFSPELLVKKQEDPDYEPLAQLIRRIGNSREPFLVPQIGIPHGPPSTQPGNAWAGQGGLAGNTVTASTAQPPFAGSFPSFGTTLTAEQQNALERRKQEEQYLMARQKEHLAQQQILVKQMQLQGQHTMHPHQLHHHSSAHSLHSQPSYGSITSPSGYQPSPPQGPTAPSQAVPGFFDNSFRAAPGSGMGPGIAPLGAGVDMLGNVRPEELPGMLDRLNVGRTNQFPYGGAPAPFGHQQAESAVHAQQVANAMNDRARLQQEQSEQDALQRLGQSEERAAQASAERLQQFHELRAQMENERSVGALMDDSIGQPTAFQGDRRQPSQKAIEQVVKMPSSAAPAPAGSEAALPPRQPDALSLTEQVQNATSAKQPPAPISPWGKVESVVPQPFPPPQSSSPLPAPAAQRKQNLADTLNPDSPSQVETPSAETPSASVAPWAKEPAEAPKGPSLREIQEAEARKAAQQEEIAAAARRAALEKDMQAQTAVPVAPGLPSSSTWGSGASPVSASSSTPSAWAKPLAGKSSASAASGKKTLQQIQKEEEARKQRAATAAASAANAANAVLGAAQALSAGKRYADLASKHASAANNAGGAWTTVGAGGKVKTPAGTVPTGPAAATKTPSVGVPQSVALKPKPVSTPSRSNTLPGPLPGQVNAHEEFKRWAVSELRSDLNKGING